MATLEERIASLEASSKSFKERITKLEAADKSLKYSISYLKTTLNKLTKSVTDIDARLKKLEGSQMQYDFMPSGGDDTVALQAKILEHIKQKKAALNLAPGNYKFSSPLQIPPGTKMFKIVGNSAVFEDISPNGSMFMNIGYDVQVNSNYNIQPSTGQFFSVNATHLSPERLSVQVPPGSSIVPGQWVYVWDEHQHISANDNGNQNATSLYNHGELAMVKEVYANTVVFTAALGRTYADSDKPKLTLIQRNVNNTDNRDMLTQNVVITGISVDSKKKSNANSIIRFGFCFNCGITDSKFLDFNSGAINILDSSFVSAIGITLRPGASGVGAGYGIVWGRGSRFTSIIDVKGPDTGDGFSVVMGHGGGMDCKASSIIAPTGKLDTHGMGELRARYEDSKVADLHFGNHMHRNGGDGHVAKDVICSSAIWVQANCANISLMGCKGSSLVLNHAYSSAGNPSGGKVESLYVSDCEFAMDITGGIITGYSGQIGKVVFERCKFTNYAQYGGILVWRDGLVGELLFDNCDFNTSTPAFYQAPIEVVGNNIALESNLTVRSSRFNCNADSEFAIGIWWWKNGKIAIHDNTFNTKRQNNARVIMVPTDFPTTHVITPNSVMVRS